MIPLRVDVTIEEFTTMLFMLRRRPIPLENPSVDTLAVAAVSNAVVPTKPVSVE